MRPFVNFGNLMVPISHFFVKQNWTNVLGNGKLMLSLTGKLMVPVTMGSAFCFMWRGVRCGLRMLGFSEFEAAITKNPKKWPKHEEEYPRWPYVVPHDMLMPLKQGITLDEIREIWRSDFRLRPGDTYFGLEKSVFDRTCFAGVGLYTFLLNST